MWHEHESRRIAEDERPRTTKNVYIYKAGDYHFSGIRIPINMRKYRTVDALLDDITTKIPGLYHGARMLVTSGGRHSVNSLDQLQHLGSYICSDCTAIRKLPKFDWNQVSTNRDIAYQFRGTYQYDYRRRSKMINDRWSRRTASDTGPTTTAIIQQTSHRLTPTTTTIIQRTSHRLTPTTKIVTKRNQINVATIAKKSSISDESKNSQHVPLSIHKQHPIETDSAIGSSGVGDSIVDEHHLPMTNEENIRIVHSIKKQQPPLRTSITSRIGQPAPLDRNKLKHVQRSNVASLINRPGHQLFDSNANDHLLDRSITHSSRRSTSTSRNSNNVTKPANHMGTETTRQSLSINGLGRTPSAAATTIQSTYRGYRQRKQYNDQRQAAINIQRFYRQYYNRNRTKHPTVVDTEDEQYSSSDSSSRSFWPSIN